MIIETYLHPREINRRELMNAIGSAIDEGLHIDQVLEPLTKARMSELAWITTFVLGPIFFVFCGARWQNEFFCFRLRRLIAALRDGEALSDALQRHMSWWVPRHHCQALKAAETEGRLCVAIAILAGKPPRIALANRLPIVYCLTLYAVAFFLVAIVFPKFVRIRAELIPGDITDPASTLVALRFISHTVALLLPVFGLLAFFVWQRSGIRESLCLRIPQFGRGWQLEAQRELAGGIAVALSHGQDIGDAVALVGQTCRFAAHRKALAACATRIAEGQPWAPILAAATIFDPFSLWMIGNSDAIERPQDGLVRVAEWCGEEAARAHRRYARRVRTLGLCLCGVGTWFVAWTCFSFLIDMIHGLDNW
jgi:type II secretory pathway component PulF